MIYDLPPELVLIASGERSQFVTVEGGVWFTSARNKGCGLTRRFREEAKQPRELRGPGKIPHPPGAEGARKDDSPEGAAGRLPDESPYTVRLVE